MTLEIATPQKTLFQGEVDSVQCKGLDGYFQILNNHAPMIAIIVKGNIKYTLKNDKNAYFIQTNKAVLKVKDNNVVILSE